MGKTLVIANPASHSGAGAEAAAVVEGSLEYYADDPASCHMLLTRATGDALGFASDAAPFDTVIAVGGDGIIHEVVNGLMRIPEGERPRMAVVPVGSGNDFARTLGMVRNDAARALRQISGGVERPIDLGLVDGETYFAETLSFGLDAAIALDTSDRRARDAVQKGSALFATSGVKIMARAKERWDYRLTLEGPDGVCQKSTGSSIVFAVQNGPTYGGGFKITPAAQPDDGLLDFCCSIGAPSIPLTLATFAAARFGMHTSSSHLRFAQLRRMEVSFATEPPSQVDGEPIHGTHHMVEVVPGALRVVFPKD